MKISFIEFFIKLTGSHANHTGSIGAYEMNDGVSSRKLHRNEAEQLVAIGFPCVALDDEKKTEVFEVIPGQIPMPGEAVEEVHRAFISSRHPNPDETPEATVKTKEPVTPIGDIDDEPTSESSGDTLYTREQLEEVADKQGLKGLREIGTPIGAKAKSIPELIELIIVAQAGLAERE